MQAWKVERHHRQETIQTWILKWRLHFLNRIEHIFICLYNTTSHLTQFAQLSGTNDIKFSILGCLGLMKVNYTGVLDSTSQPEGKNTPVQLHTRSCRPSTSCNLLSVSENVMWILGTKNALLEYPAKEAHRKKKMQALMYVCLVSVSEASYWFALSLHCNGSFSVDKLWVHHAGV